MKNLKVLSFAAFCLIVIMLLSACGIMKKNDFTSQKYTHFRKGEASISIHQVAKEKKEVNLIPSVPENKIAILKVPVITDESSKTVVASLSEIKKENRNNIFTKDAIKAKFNRASSFVTSRFVRKTNTTSVNDGDTSMLILIILAIILPPLCVFLVNGLGTNFWLDLILTILFWVPGVIFALLVLLHVV